MAELSERDRKAILGERYMEIEQAARKSSGRTDNEQAKAERIDKTEAQKFNAVALVIVGLILLVSNFYAVSGPSLLFVTGLAIAFCVIGVAWYARIIMVLRQLAATA
jgi:hypothetical protein